jgi:hypothetical protein
MSKQKFVFQPHFRLQEWVVEEKGYFREEGLDYVFGTPRSGSGSTAASARTWHAWRSRSPCRSG